MGGLLLKSGGFPPFFVLFLVCDGRFGVFLSLCVWSGAVVVCCCGWWFRFCVMWRARADFRGIGCCRVRGGGCWGACLWWCGA